MNGWGVNVILGIDFSLTATGVCAITDGEAECITIRSKKEETWWEFPERVQTIGDEIASWAHSDGESVDAWVIETPAFMAKGQLDRLFGGWWMLVELMMREWGWPAPLRVTPSQLKKFATGAGNANKDEVMLAVSRRFPDVHVSDNNQTDALALAAIGAAVFDEPFNGELTKAQLSLVEAVRSR